MIKTGDLVYHKDYAHIVYKVVDWDGGKGDHAFILLDTKISGWNHRLIDFDGWISPDQMCNWRIYEGVL